MPTKGCGDINTGPVLDTRNQRIEYSSTLSYHHSMVQLYFINYYIYYSYDNCCANLLLSQKEVQIQLCLYIDH